MDSHGAKGNAASPTSDDATTTSTIEHYDAHYVTGGFGYRERRPYWLAWAREHYVEEFDLPAGATVLDVGCGDGFWSGVLAELGLRPTGVDFAPGAIALARAREPGIPFVVADATRLLPFRPASFDVVFCRGSSNLARPDLQDEATREFLANLMRYVAQGGLLLVSYSTQRRGGGPPEHTHHPASRLVEAMEMVADPCHLALVGNALQIGAQRRDSPRTVRRSARPTPGRSAGQRLATLRGRILRRLGRRRHGGRR